MRISVGSAWAVWVRGCNLQGSAMPTASLINEFSESAFDVQAHVLPVQSVAMPCFSSGRMWALRWRRRHGAKHMILPVKESLLADGLRAKVPVFVEPLGIFFEIPGTQFWVPESAQKRNPRLRTPSCTQKWVPKLTEKWVPEISDFWDQFCKKNGTKSNSETAPGRSRKDDYQAVALWQWSRFIWRQASI